MLQLADFVNNQPAFTNLNLPKPPLRLIGTVTVLVLILIMTWTSFYTVPAESEAVVLRFAKFLKTERCLPKRMGIPNNCAAFLKHQRRTNSALRRNIIKLQILGFIRGALPIPFGFGNPI